MKQTEVYAVKCGLANVFLLKGEKTIIIDTGLRGSTPKILYEMKQRGIQQSDISLLLLTHVHPDHSLNACDLTKTLRVPLAVNALEAEYLEKGIFSPVVPTGRKGKMLYASLESIHKKHNDVLKADITFQRRLNLREYGIDGYAEVIGGHSHGATVVYFDKQNCIIGDLIMRSLLRTPSFPPFAVDKQKMEQGVYRVLSSGIRTIYTSHGKSWDVDKLKKSRFYKKIKKNNP